MNRSTAMNATLAALSLGLIACTGLQTKEPAPAQSPARSLAVGPMPACGSDPEHQILKDSFASCGELTVKENTPDEWTRAIVGVLKDPEDFATKSRVCLTTIATAGPADKTQCTKRPMLDYGDRIHVNSFGDGQWTLTIMPANTLARPAIVSLTPNFGMKAPVPTEIRWLGGSADGLDYYVYLAFDIQPGPWVKKFYWVDIFDTKDSNADCKSERPEAAFKMLTTEQCFPKGVRAADVPNKTMQTSAGGGAEPPPR